MRNASEILNESTARVERIIYIPGAICADSITREFRDFIEEMIDEPKVRKTISDAIPAIKRMFAIADESGEEVEDWIVTEALMFTGGFFVEAATPVMTPFGDLGASSFSWGHYYTEWLYAPNEEAIARVVSAWADKRHDEDSAVAKGAA